MGLRSFERSGHTSKFAARTAYALMNLPFVALLGYAFAVHREWWTLVGIVAVVANAFVGWFVYDGAYRLFDDGPLIDLRPRPLTPEEEAIKAYEQNPSAGNRTALQRIVSKQR